MNDAEVAALLNQLVQLLGNHSHAAGCDCPKCCGCTTEPLIESSAVRHNESQAFLAAESNKSFVQQQGAQFQQMLAQQQEFTKTLNEK